jgi:plastocyanin
MSRKQIVALIVLVPVVIIAGLMLGRSFNGSSDNSSSSIKISSADDATAFAYDILIPPGTAGRIDAGEEIEIVPDELVVKVGEAIRIVNNDSADHIVGVFFVASGETLTQRFNSEGVFSGECSVHPSGSFTLRVEA